MNLKIRQATPDDLDEMQRLFVETIQSSCKSDYSPEQISVWTSSVKKKARWENLLQDQLVLIAEMDHKIVGYGSLKEGHYLDFMYVHKDHLRKGIANQIFEELKKEAKRLAFHKLSSDVSKTARPFFEKKGFKVVRENKIVVNGVELVNYHMVLERE